ncbi:MAG: hypothetical protein JNL67_18245 [Planctomycetaceae bacterium]|nr:hypothetical protein [Planctomycetaceae bacterium]
MDRYQLEIVSLPAMTWLSVAYRSSEDRITEQVAAALALVYTLASELGIAVHGHPQTHFGDRHGPQFMAQTGFPILELLDLNLYPLAKSIGRCSVAGFGPLQQEVLPTSRAISTLHRGPYSSLSVGHRTMRSWGRDNEFQFCGGPREVYLTDPIMASDPRTLETRLYQPIEG